MATYTTVPLERRTSAPGLPLRVSGGLPPPRPSASPAPALIQSARDPADILKQVGDISPSLAAVLRPQAAYRWLLPYLASITPEYVESVLRGALAGNHVQAWELFDLMMDSDSEVSACVQEWTNGIIAKRMVVEAYHEEDQLPTPKAVQKQKLISAALKGMRPDPANDENAIDGTIRDIAASRFHGQSLLEVDWMLPNGSLNIRNLPGIGNALCPRSTYWVHPVCYAWDVNGRIGLRTAVADMPGVSQYVKTTKLGKVNSMVEPPAWNWISSQPRPSQLTDFPENKFLIGIHKSKTGTALSGSVLRNLAWWWVASNFCGGWLLNYAQLFGIPFRKATYSPNTSEPQKQEIRQMLQACGSTGYILMPEGADLEFMNSGQSAGQSPQAFLFHFADSQKRKVILHQTMTGGQHDSMGKGGGKAFGQVEKDTKDECIGAGARFVEEILNNQFIPMICAVNYNRDTADDEAPSVRLIDDESGNLEDAQTLQIVSQIVDVPSSYVHKLFQIPAPQDDDEIAGKDVGTSSKPPPKPAQPALPPGTTPADQEPEGKTDKTGKPVSGRRIPVIAGHAATEALRDTVEPMLERLKAIEAVKDKDTRKKLMKKFLKDAPHIAAAMVHDDSLAKAITPDLIRSIITGLKKGHE